MPTRSATRSGISIWLVEGFGGKTRVWREKTLWDVPGKENVGACHIRKNSSAVSAEMNAGKLVSLMFFVLPTIHQRLTKERFYAQQSRAPPGAYLQGGIIIRRTARWRSFITDGGELL